ncbi:MAG: hypothetical protein DLM58_13665 [Pseudonocardiales bacterium]|nr:MAG: hypothetical protein DLM58_13665 [Pseudonocardiales bacterium]
MAMVLSLFILVTIFVSARVKNQTAADLRVSNQGTQLFGFDVSLTDVATRVDLGSPLQQALAYRHDHNTQVAVAWPTQVQAGIPRIFWPGKPIVDYGQQVSVAVYGLRYGESSSFITVIGDTLVNFDVFGVVVGAFLLGLAISRLERRVRRGSGEYSLVLAAVLVNAVLGGEVTLILTLVTAVKSFLVVLTLWIACSCLNPKAPIAAVAIPSREL